MADPLTTISGLILAPMNELAIQEMARLCAHNDPLPSPLKGLGMEWQVTRLVGWAAVLRPLGGGLWSVRAPGGEMLGAVVVRPQGPQRGAEIGVALTHRQWGLGHALDIARVIARRSGADDWALRAESVLPPPRPTLARMTFPQLLALPADVLPREERAAVAPPLRARPPAPLWVVRRRSTEQYESEKT